MNFLGKPKIVRGSAWFRVSDLAKLGSCVAGWESANCRLYLVVELALLLQAGSEVSHKDTFRSSEERNRASWRAGPGNGKICVSVVIAHFRGLDIPVRLVLLGDTGGVDPELSDI